jgi:hypothetical protein
MVKSNVDIDKLDCPLERLNEMIKRDFPNGFDDFFNDEEEVKQKVKEVVIQKEIKQVPIQYDDEELTQTKKWMLKMNIDGKPNDHVEIYKKWKKHRDNLQVVGTLENIIYRFHDCKVNYQKLLSEMEYLENWNKTTLRMDIVVTLKERKAKGITTLIPPTKEEITKQWTDFGFENRNPYVSDGDYQKLFDYWKKETNKQFKSKKEELNTLYKMMETTQTKEYGVIESMIDFKVSEYKRINKK